MVSILLPPPTYCSALQNPHMHASVPPAVNLFCGSADDGVIGFNVTTTPVCRVNPISSKSPIIEVLQDAGLVVVPDFIDGLRMGPADEERAR